MSPAAPLYWKPTMSSSFRHGSSGGHLRATPVPLLDALTSGALTTPDAGRLCCVTQAQERPAHLTCQPLLRLAPPDTPYLPFDAAHDGYPFFNPAT